MRSVPKTKATANWSRNDRQRIATLFSTPEPEVPADVKRGTMMLADGADIPAGDGRLFATPAVTKMERPDGSIILRSEIPLKSCARCVGDWLEHWARQTPQRIFL